MNLIARCLILVVVAVVGLMQTTKELVSTAWPPASWRPRNAIPTSGEVLAAAFPLVDAHAAPLDKLRRLTMQNGPLDLSRPRLQRLYRMINILVLNRLRSARGHGLAETAPAAGPTSSLYRAARPWDHRPVARVKPNTEISRLSYHSDCGCPSQAVVSAISWAHLASLFVTQGLNV
jgi:hypothetical protein